MTVASAESRIPGVRLIGGHYRLDIAVIKGSCPVPEYRLVSEYDRTHVDVAAI